MRRPRGEEGTFLILSLVIVFIAAGFAYAAVLAASAELRDTGYHGERLRAEYVAMAGFERGVEYLLEVRKRSTLDEPFALFDQLDQVQVYDGEPLVMEGRKAGEYDVSLEILPDPVDAVPGEVVTNPLTDAGGFTSQVTATDRGDGTTHVEVLFSSDGLETTPALSHVTFGLPPEARALAAATATSGGGYPVEVADPDPTTGVSGIKYDSTTLGEGGAESDFFGFDIPTGSAATLTVASKAGPGSSAVLHSIAAPSAERPWARENRRHVRVVAVGWRPDKATPQAVRVEVRGDVLVALEPASIFDYAYFLNNWGWFYGSTIFANGNVRSNGQFDGGQYASTVNGEPRYEASDRSTLLGYLDDNGDGLADDRDGGIYSGWDVVQAERIQGAGGNPENQYPFFSQLPMPNLTELGIYEDLANRKGGSISVGGRTVCDGVGGDDEPANLYLSGTAIDPIVIDGPVVVRGDVIISGVVSGQGAIYAGGNVYVAKDLTYASPPSTWRPSSVAKADREAWRERNRGADALGLFAREHIVLGDYTNTSWRSNVSSWLGNPMNESREDSGRDFIPNTAAGKDGVPGTQDDDALEGDGIWTVESYTESDAAQGLVPAGKQVGDAIPGTGEDIDGDGAYDERTSLAEFEVATLSPSNWVNLPAGVTRFAQVSTTNFRRFDACLYTNHHLGGLVVNRGGTIQFNGAVVSRNESIVYSANRLELNHDDRLTAGGGETFGLYLPLVWAELSVTRWEIE